MKKFSLLETKGGGKLIGFYICELFANFSVPAKAVTKIPSAMHLLIVANAVVSVLAPVGLISQSCHKGSNI